MQNRFGLPFHNLWFGISKWISDVYILDVWAILIISFKNPWLIRFTPIKNPSSWWVPNHRLEISTVPSPSIWIQKESRPLFNSVKFTAFKLILIQLSNKNLFCISSKKIVSIFQYFAISIILCSKVLNRDLWNKFLIILIPTIQFLRLRDFQRRCVEGHVVPW